MAYIYENDITKTSANLQKTVAYLVSLHKNEYEWNMLGIKVVGHVDALPIPTGNYDYGDAYMVGTETPYEMYVYTRADDVHKVPYWFNIGKFPQPGEPGPAGPSMIDVKSMTIDGVNSIIYDTDDGAVIDYGSTKLTYVDPNTHETKNDNIDLVELKLPIKPGKYISMDSDDQDLNLEIKVDDTALAADYYKIDKSSVTQITVPVNNKGIVGKMVATQYSSANTVVLRDPAGDSLFRIIYANALSKPGTSYDCNTEDIYKNIYNDFVISKTSTNTGTLEPSVLSEVTHIKRSNIIYDNQVYYRMDPTTTPDGTLTFIHIDTLQNGSGGYKATGKAFSITVSTRAWQVVDLDFGGTSTNLYNHHIMIQTNTADRYFIDVTDSHEQYDSTSEIGRVHLNPINAYFGGAGATTVYTVTRVRFSDDGSMEVINVDNSVREAISGSYLTVSDQAGLIS